MSLWIDQKYVGLVSPRLNRFKKKSDKVYNLRCPYCGDSKKDKLKARGYLFIHKDAIFYKCHNCNVSTSLFKFLEFLDPSLANAYKLENYAQNVSNTIVYKSETPKTEVKVEQKDSLAELGVVPLTKVSSSSKVMKYVRERRIPEERYDDLYYAEDMKVFEKLNPAYENRIVSEERLIIPYRDKFGNLSGVTGRAINPSRLRYINVRLSEYPMIYGLKYVDQTQTIYVCEGAIDSMFINNGIAVGGSDLKRAINMFPKEKLVLIFDNEPRNKQIITIMEKMIQYGYRLMIWPNEWQYKDINEAIINGIDKRRISDLLYRNTHQDLSLKLAIRNWKKI